MAAERITVACPAGHEIRTRARSRGVQCSECGKTVYVRADGTTRRVGQDVPDRRQRPAEPAPADPAAGAARSGRRRGGWRVFVGGHPYEDVAGAGTRGAGRG